ncbi:hypothetical protein GJV85_07455 [Sulfurimonas aquatica]|uniref:Pilus formation protein N-terminal domain-containing protein n=1 Tax=Sulfurimonas aquatica TaxID=2672570 RepID=A0A975GD53_9BACT|nr:pilus assembly protein N-terminal domain-containing protein [Sulfurimonas aquatica]QSZ41949.1 hypothetical protein GJV85_07455 [Sulfurimonas aquatica]
MKKIILLLAFCIALFGEDIVVFENEYKVLQLEKKVKSLVVGNKMIMNISILGSASRFGTNLKLFGKKSGNTSILITYSDNSIENYHVYVNQNLGFIQKMINTIEPELQLSKVGDGSTVISGKFKDPHEKKRIYELLESAGIDLTTLMDITQTDKINKMIRTKLYLVEINNNKAKDLGGVTGLGYFDEYTNVSLNPSAMNSATFSGWLLDNTGAFFSSGKSSLVGSLNFLESKGIAKILDDTVLITTEDRNASFHVGGKVYIPVGVTQTGGGFPTIQLEEKEYGLRLTLNTDFLEKENFMHVDVHIVDSQFDPNEEHNIQLGTGGFGSEPIVIPSFVSKEISTDVVAKSKNVIALGGRLHSEEVEAEEKIPFLGDIPLIGELFKHTVTSNKNNDLLFFIVPEIIDANEDINDSNYYRDLKLESETFNNILMDMNSSNEGRADSLVLIKKELAEVEDTPSPKEKIVQKKVQEKPLTQNITPQAISTLVEEENLEEELVLNTAEVEAKKTIFPTVERAKKVEKIETALAPEFISNEEELIINEEVNTQKKTTPKIDKQYKVTAQNIYVRSKPTDGYTAEVWAQGHPFTVEQEVTQDGLTWVKVKQDCKDGCRDAKEELWISKKYTEEL